jgi:hypothetical protein
MSYCLILIFLINITNYKTYIYLSETISLAGLGGKGCTAKCCRPTAANAAIQAGYNPETTMYIGRWKTKEVFFNHYVYPLAPRCYTDGVQVFDGFD